MEAIALIKSKQTKLNKRVDAIKSKIKKGDIKIKEDIVKPKKKDKSSKDRGAVYIGHIPHGFYENEVKAYFSQFGTVTRVRLARSRKTGRCKGYGFVEFLSSEVAKIAAETMNNYLMFNRLLKCRYIPPEEQHGKMFVRTVEADRFPKQSNRRKEIKKKNKIITTKKEEEVRKKYEKKIAEFKKFFDERGIEFNFKVNDPNHPDMSSSHLKVTKVTNGDESDVSLDSDYEDETDDQYGVLEIDESDDEIQFKTPPQVKKVIKRSSTSTLIPPKSKKFKTNSQSFLEAVKDQWLKNDEFSKKNKSNSLSQLSSAFQSKFPKIQGNLKKWAKTLNETKKEKKELKKPNPSKGVGQKFQKKIQKEMKLSKSLKPKKKQNIHLKSIKKGIAGFLDGDQNQNKKKLISPEKNKKLVNEKQIKSAKLKAQLSPKANTVKPKKILKEKGKMAASKVKNVLKKNSDGTQKLLTTTKKKKKKDQLNGNMSKVVAKKFGVKTPKLTKKSKVVTKKANASL